MHTYVHAIVLTNKCQIRSVSNQETPGKKVNLTWYKQQGRGNHGWCPAIGMAHGDQILGSLLFNIPKFMQTLLHKRN